jgi:hypothetical protein
MKFNRNKKLIIGVLCDIIGMISYLIPGLGELSDVIWAPLSLYIMIKMYKGRVGKVTGAVSFIEEALLIDFVPTFTLMWLYTYKIKKQHT